MKTPTTSPLLSVRIPAQMLSTIDQLAKQTGISRSTLVRICLTEGMHKIESMAKSLKK